MENLDQLDSGGSSLTLAEYAPLETENLPDQPFFPDEPLTTWTIDDFHRLLLWGITKKMADLEIRSEDRAWVRIYGIWRPATVRPLLSHHVFMILDYVSNNRTASTTIKSQNKDLDFGYEFERKRGERVRFRCNGCGIAIGYSTGVRITFRSIAEEPPYLKNYNIEEGLLEHAYPRDGLVLLTGVVSCGKSTLIAGMMREILEKGGRHVLTYEDPVEFNFDAMKNRNGPVSQCQVPTHIQSFAEGIRNSTRSSPDVIMVGEARDAHTLQSMMLSADTGVAAYSTVHTRSVPETMTRIINTFHADVQQQMAASLTSTLRLVVNQRLYTKATGVGQIALREYLPYTAKIRETLLQTPRDQIISTTERLLFKYGQPMQRVAQKYYDEGVLHKLDYLAIMAERNVEKYANL